MFRKLLFMVALWMVFFTAVPAWADTQEDLQAIDLPSQNAAQKPSYQDPGQTTLGSGNPMTDTSQQQLLQTINGLSSYYANYLKNQGADWVANTDFSLSFNNLSLWNNPVFRATSIQPFGSSFSFENTSLSFWQISAAYENTSFTGNVGVGYRKLTDSRAQMFGVNLFYDALWANNTFQAPTGYTNYKAADGTPLHQRVGIGLEYFLYALELRANGYYAVSSDQLLGTAYQVSNDISTPWNFYERAANGYDVSLSYQLPFVPWLKANVAGYQYFTNAASGNMTQEQAYRGTLNGLYVGGTMQLTPRISIDGGYDNGGTGSGFVKATYNVLALPQPSLLWSDETINDYSKYNVSNKLLNKVQRNNNITTVVYAKNGTASALGGVVTVSVTDYQGNPQKNVPVMLANSDYSVAIVNQTGTDGKVVFSGLPTGNNSTPSDLNAKFVAARATGAVSDVPQSYSYYVVTNLKQYDWTAGGGWQDVEVLNTASLQSLQNETINITGQPQPDKSSSDQPAPDPESCKPKATTLTVTVTDEEGNPRDLSGATDIAAAVGSINTNGGSGVQIQNSEIDETKLSQGIITITCSNAKLPTDDGYINYGSGMYGVTFKYNGLNYGASQAVTIGTNASTTLCVTTNPTNIQSLTVYFKGKQVNNQPFVLTNTVVDNDGKSHQVYIAAATAIDLSKPIENAAHIKVGNNGGTGVACFSGTSAIVQTSSTLAAVAYYYKDDNPDNNDSSNFAVLGADPKIVVQSDNTASCSIAQFPFSIN